MVAAPEIVIRRVSLADAISLARIHAESFGAACWSVDQLRGSLSLCTTQGWASFANDQLTGFILCQVTAEEKEVLTFCVRLQERRQGIGAKLLMRIIETDAAKDTLLEVAANNEAARHLYERCGFVITNVRRGYYKQGVDFIDAVHYRKTGIKN